MLISASRSANDLLKYNKNLSAKAIDGNGTN